MRISELSARTAVPVATIKYYLREGLVPPGRSTAATQADYDETHVARIRLVRALAEVGGLSLAAVRGVLDALDEDSVPAAVAVAHQALSPAVRPGTERATLLLTALDWPSPPDSSALRRLDEALAGLEAAGLNTSPERLAGYAEAALTLARREVSAIPGGGADEAVRFVVLGTVLYEPVLLALRRLAQARVYRESQAARRSAVGAESQAGPTAQATSD